MVLDGRDDAALADQRLDDLRRLLGGEARARRRACTRPARDRPPAASPSLRQLVEAGVVDDQVRQRLVDQVALVDEGVALRDDRLRCPRPSAPAPPARASCPSPRPRRRRPRRAPSARLRTKSGRTKWKHFAPSSGSMVRWQNWPGMMASVSTLSPKRWMRARTVAARCLSAARASCAFDACVPLPRLRRRLDDLHLRRPPRFPLAEDAAELLLIDAGQQRARVGDLHARRRSRHRRRRGEPARASRRPCGSRSCGSATEPLLALAGLARGDAEAHRAAGRVDPEPGALVDLPESGCSQMFLNRQIARNHELLVDAVAGPLGARRLEHQRRQHQLFLGGGAGADEEPLQLRARQPARPARRCRARTAAPPAAQSVRDRSVTSERTARRGRRGSAQRLVAVAVVRVRAAGEPGGDHLVGLEDAVQAAELRRHVGDGEAQVGGEAAGRPRRGTRRCAPSRRCCGRAARACAG